MVRVIGYIDSNKQCLRHTHTHTNHYPEHENKNYLLPTGSEEWEVFLLQYFSLVMI